MPMEQHGHKVGASTIEEKTAPCLGSEWLRTLPASDGPLQGDGSIVLPGTGGRALRHASL